MAALSARALAIGRPGVASGVSNVLDWCDSSALRATGGAWPNGKAADSGSAIWRFESSRPSHPTSTARSVPVSEETGFSNFIRQIVEADLAAGRHTGVVTRFPPEPNGYLHIGHAKSICLNFGIARDYRGRCHLRFDDTNPVKEDVEYIESIQEDVRWLGFDWGEHLYHAADYFERLYEWAERLVRAGHAYVCDLSADEIRRTRGTLTEPGTDSPYRDRTVEENLDLLRRMRAGEFP